MLCSCLPRRRCWSTLRSLRCEIWSRAVACVVLTAAAQSRNVHILPHTGCRPQLRSSPEKWEGEA
eukprot:2179312-Rhodomonas_salina.2